MCFCYCYENDYIDKVQDYTSKIKFAECSSCKSTEQIQRLFIVDPTTGETICQRCGAVVEQKNNANQNQGEYRSFTTKEAKHRSQIGIPTSLARHDMGLATVIGKWDKDASGRKINGLMHTTMERLRICDTRTQAHARSDRSLRRAFLELNILKDKLGLPDPVIEKTAYTFRKAQGMGLARGRTITAVISAAAYIACREMETPRTLKHFAESINVKQKNLARSYNTLVLELDIKVPMIDPIKCVVTVANKANLSEQIKRQAINVMNEVTKKGISAGKDPMGLAAALLYLSSRKTKDDSITQSQLAISAGVTEVTVRNRMKELLKEANGNSLLSQYGLVIAVRK